MHDGLHRGWRLTLRLHECPKLMLGASVSGGVTGVVDLFRSSSTLLTFFCVYRDPDEHVYKDDFPLA